MTDFCVMGGRPHAVCPIPVLLPAKLSEDERMRAQAKLRVRYA
jgi:hypothetical protein